MKIKNLLVPLIALLIFFVAYIKTFYRTYELSTNGVKINGTVICRERKGRILLTFYEYNVGSEKYRGCSGVRKDIQCNANYCVVYNSEQPEVSALIYDERTCLNFKIEYWDLFSYVSHITSGDCKCCPPASPSMPE